jgi:hypothetical protein
MLSIRYAQYSLRLAFIALKRRRNRLWKLASQGLCQITSGAHSCCKHLILPRILSVGQPVTLDWLEIIAYKATPLLIKSATVAQDTFGRPQDQWVALERRGRAQRNQRRPSVKPDRRWFLFASEALD